MNNKFSADEQLKQAFNEYRSYLVPTSVLFGGLILIIAVIIPQFQSWLDLQKQVNDNKQQVEVMRRNLQLLSSMDDQDLDSKLNLVATALPSDKDLYGIVTAINRAGISSGASIGDYSFSGSAGASSSSVSIALVVSGNIDTIRRFITEIKKQLPLADVSEARIVGNGTGSTINIVFYYKSFPRLAFHGNQPIDGLTPREQDLLNQLNDFQYDASSEASVTLPQ